MSDEEFNIKKLNEEEYEFLQFIKRGKGVEEVEEEYSSDFLVKFNEIIKVKDGVVQPSNKVKEALGEALPDLTADLEDVRKKYKEWLHIEDMNRIDVMLAVALSKQLVGTSLWLIIVGPSGDGKTEMVKAMEGLDDVRKIQQLTENTLISGNPEVEDLAPKLDGKIMLITDFASILSLKSDKKRELWAQLRNLYDGEAFKDTGAGPEAKYDGIRTTMLACSTPAIDNQILIHQDLGTRELIYRTDGSGVRDKQIQALKNEEEEEKMRRELKEVVHGFLKKKDIKDIGISEEMKEFLMERAEYLAKMRASASFDSYSGELRKCVDVEVPTRVVKQFKRLYICLKSLAEDYPDERAKKIINHVVDSSCVPLRVKTKELLEESNPQEFSTSQVAEKLQVGKKTAKMQLNALWNIGEIKKRVERQKKFGRIMEISYWRDKDVEFNLPDFRPLSEEEEGHCEYCDKEYKKLKWKDEDGYKLCDSCKEEEIEAAKRRAEDKNEGGN